MAGRRAAAADDRGARGRPRGRDPRRHRDRPDVPLGRALRRGGRDRRAARLLPGRRRRRPRTGEWLLHEPIPLELAREAIAAVEAEGFALNCYVDDELYVADDHRARPRATPTSRASRCTEVGDLLGWIERPPTKLVVVDDPGRLDALRPRLEEQFGGRLYIAKSLPYFLELASPAISKGSGLAFVAEHLGFTRRADGRVRRRRERSRAARLGRLRRRGRERARSD